MADVQTWRITPVGWGDFRTPDRYDAVSTAEKTARCDVRKPKRLLKNRRRA
jgi:hypothetical protein